MKTIRYSFMVIILLFFTSCGGDDEVNVEPVEEDSEELLEIRIGPQDRIYIRFVHEDGTEILPDECIDPNITYGVAIELRLHQFPSRATKPIEYTVNGALYNMTFRRNGIQVNPIRLEFNQNIAQLVATGRYSDIIYITDQGDFELVD